MYINNHYHSNIYRGRGGIVTRDNHNFGARGSVGRPISVNGGRPGGGFNNGGARPTSVQGGRPGGRPGGGNNVFSDRSGNVYQRNQSNNQWQQRSNNSWRPVTNNPSVQQNLNRQQQMRDRGQTRTQNFNQARSGAAAVVLAGPVVEPAPLVRRAAVQGLRAAAVVAGEVADD